MTIEAALRIVRRRLGMSRGLHRGASAFLVAAVLVVAAGLLGRLLGRSDLPWTVLLGAPLLAGLAGAVVGFADARRTPFRLAATMDRRLGLDESTSSALFVRDDATTAPELREALLEQASGRLDTLRPDTIQRAFRPARPDRLFLGVGILVAGLVLPLVPAVIAPPENEDPTEERTVRERQRTREAARRLRRDAERIERVMALKELDRAAVAAKKVRERANTLAQRTPKKSSALSRVNRARKDVRRRAGKALGRGAGEEVKNALQAAATASRNLAEADAEALASDLQAFRQALAKEAATARREQRAPRLDAGELEALRRRADALEKALRETEDLLADNPELRKRLEDALRRQQELLERLQEKLDRLAETLEQAADPSSGRRLTSEELEGLAEALENLTPEDLEALLDALEELEAMGALDELLEQARHAMSGEPCDRPGECPGGS